jgi:antitoxin (DNA-binding transcriptional repressor) of toxin-antitoxin stability system
MPESTRITATELARNLSDILSRVRYRGESFEVLRNGEVVAELRPSSLPKQITWGEFLELWATFPKPDEDYWKDLEEAKRSQPPLHEPPSWDS